MKFLIEDIPADEFARAYAGAGRGGKGVTVKFAQPIKFEQFLIRTMDFVWDYDGWNATLFLEVEDDTRPVVASAEWSNLKQEPRALARALAEIVSTVPLSQPALEVLRFEG